MSIEQILMIVVILELLVIFFLGLKLKETQKVAKLYSDMYIESAEILSDLVIKDESMMDFYGDLAENGQKFA